MANLSVETQAKAVVEAQSTAQEKSDKAENPAHKEHWQKVRETLEWAEDKIAQQ